MKRNTTRVAVLYNAPVLPADHPDHASEAEVVAVARTVARTLKGVGFKAWPLAARVPPMRLVRSLSRQKPDVVFNLVEGYGGNSAGEAHVTSLLELLGVPYTGCPPEALGLCRHKGRTKALLRGCGLPTAPFVVVGPDDPTPTAADWPGEVGPVIVKPVAEDASLGIELSSVVGLADTPALAGRIEQVHAAYGPEVLVEAFLPGTEFIVGVLALPEPEALPVAEVVYELPPDTPTILSYASKWDSGSIDYRGSPVRCPAEAAPEMLEEVGRLAVAAFRATDCRDYARVDFRLDGSGRPMILEVNPNPDLDPEAGLSRALRVAGRDYAATLSDLVRQALRRGPDRG